jgi:rare lipoprotein A
MFGIPASVAALTTGQALAASAPAQSPATVQAVLKARRIAFGEPAVVTGTVPAAELGHTLDLEFLPSGGTAWQALSHAVPAANGRFRLSAPLRRSGFLRVVDASSGPVVAQSASTTTQHVAVTAALRVRRQALAALAGQGVTVRGRLLPGLGGRIVRLQGLRGGTWHNLAAARTGGAGRFALRFTPSGGSERIRIRFAGDGSNARVSAPAGTVSAYDATVASWYYDGGTTGCGFHAYYGVANKSLPCGTQVKFRYGGRSVTAVVDDRGPYVGGRAWDLNQNTAGALGFGGVGVVWSSL